MERLLDYFVPEKYVLDIAVDKFKKTIGGEVVIEGIAKAKTIKFHSVNLKIDSVEVDGTTVDFKVKKETVEVYLSIISQNPIKVKIIYRGKLNENMEGAYLSSYEYEGRKEIIVATQFESHYARQAFPCIDEPAAKAVFELSIRLPEGSDDLILTNMPMGEPTPRMSTYLLAFVIGKFHGKTVTNKSGTKITTYCALNQDIDSVDFANEIAARSLEFYEENFKVKYPLSKLDQVALPDFEAGAMENWGLVTYRESMLLAGKTATLSTKKSVSLTVAHELSHQWFGDLVTMEWWDDLWLNESFAAVMEYYASDAIHPEFQIFENFFTGDCFAALTRDAYSDVQSVHQEVSEPAEIATLFDSAIVYSKGAHLIFMLVRLIGWDKFCKGLTDYFEKHAYQNTVGDDLWEALSPYADFDVRKLMHSLTDWPGYPVITSRGEVKSSEYFALEETKFAEIIQRRFLLDDEKMPESDWPLPKITEDMSGHYILNLSEEEFNERLEKFDQLSLEEKLRLLIDRSLVSRTELASAADLVPLVLKFKSESSAAVWSIISVIVGQLKIFFTPESSEEAKFKKFIGTLVADKLAEIGLETGSNDDENTIRLRAILLGLDFYAETKSNLEKLASKYTKDYEALDPEIRNDILDAKLYLLPELLDEYLDAYIKTADPEIKFDLLLAMTLSKDEENIAKMIGLLEKPEIVKPQDQLYLYIFLYRNYKAKKEVWDWLISHWDYVKELSGDKSIDSYPRLIANSIRTEEDFNDFKAFFDSKKSDSALSRAIKIGEKEIRARIKLIQKNQAEVYRAVEEVV